MKQIYMILMLLVILTCGCTKQYDDINKYKSDMSKVRQQLKNYTIMGDYSANGMNFKFKSFIKDKKWKTITVADNKYTYTYLYDGNNIYLYDNKIIVKNPINPYAKNSVNGQNPINPIIDWDFDEFKKPNEKQLKINGTKKINGFDCREVSNSIYKACISDKYGIAINSISSIIRENKKITVQYNIINITNDDISDTQFNVPKGLIEISAEKLAKHQL